MKLTSKSSLVGILPLSVHYLEGNILATENKWILEDQSKYNKQEFRNHFSQLHKQERKFSVEYVYNFQHKQHKECRNFKFKFGNYCHN